PRRRVTKGDFVLFHSTATHLPFSKILSARFLLQWVKPRDLNTALPSLIGAFLSLVRKWSLCNSARTAKRAFRDCLASSISSLYPYATKLYFLFLHVGGRFVVITIGCPSQTSRRALFPFCNLSSCSGDSFQFS